MGASLQKQMIEDMNFGYVLVGGSDKRSRQGNNRRDSQGLISSPSSDMILTHEEGKRKGKKLRPVTFHQLSSLTRIGMCSQGLVKLSSNIGILGDKAEILQVCCNTIKSLPTEIGYLINLRVLSISHNRLKELPESLGFLTKLVELRASDNSIKTLPRSISALSKLTTLILDRNQLERMPEEIGFLESLVTLDLSFNTTLENLPAEINRLKYLRYLNFEGCPFSEVASEYNDYPPIQTLKEIAARLIIREDLAITPNISPMIQKYLVSVHECTFCGGPYFESFTTRGKWLIKGRTRIPLEYRLCKSHWRTEEERVERMFQGRPETSPSVEKGDHFTSNLFNSFSPTRNERPRSNSSLSTLSRNRSSSFPVLNSAGVEEINCSRRSSFSHFLRPSNLTIEEEEEPLVSLKSLALPITLPKIKTPINSNPSDSDRIMKRSKSLSNMLRGFSSPSARKMKKSASADLLQRRPGQ